MNANQVKKIRTKRVCGVSYSLGRVVEVPYHEWGTLMAWRGTLDKLIQNWYQRCDETEEQFICRVEWSICDAVEVQKHFERKRRFEDHENKIEAKRQRNFHEKYRRLGDKRRDIK